MSANSTISSLLCSSQQYLVAAAIIVLPYVGGILSSLVTAKELKGQWYKNLKKPFFNPPSWLFAPVWTSIYTCIGVSSYLIYRQGGFGATSLPLVLYGTQLLLNWAWSPIFFYFHRIDLVRAIATGKPLNRGLKTQLGPSILSFVERLLHVTIIVTCNCCVLWRSALFRSVLYRIFHCSLYTSIAAVNVRSHGEGRDTLHS